MDTIVGSSSMLLNDTNGVTSWIRELIAIPDLDARVGLNPELLRGRTEAAQKALYAWSSGRLDERDAELELARRDMQHGLYELNRLKLYWFDDPGRYSNEHSVVLAELRADLETPWQQWLLQQTADAATSAGDVVAAIRSRAALDATPSDTAERRWFGEEMDVGGYRRLLEIASLNGLVEASQLSRALGGSPSPVQSTLTRIFLEEYGNGRAEKKHSTYFARMLDEQGMDSTPEAYLGEVPWEVLAAINHSFHLAESKQLYLRFCGAFTYTEVSTPASFDGYARAAKRLGFSDGRDDYWSLHIREDQRHGAWMVDEVVVPLCERFPRHRREVLLGYEQQRFVESLAGAATTRECRAAAKGQYQS
jgi:hypothetical protein